MVTLGEDLPLDLSTKRDTCSPLSSKSNEIIQLLTRDNARRYPCISCNIGFSSLKTLSAHQQFYCTKTSVACTPQTNHPTPFTLATFSPSITPEIQPKTPPKEVSDPTVSQSPRLTQEKAGQFCPDCAFRANTIRGLRSHITKYHSKEAKNPVKAVPRKTKTTATRTSVIVGPKRVRIDGTPSSAATVSAAPEKKKYCKYCDIYFRYLSTFLAHRKFYCTVRKTETSDGKPTPDTQIS